MEREQAIEILLTNLRVMNAEHPELEEGLKQARERYEKMTDRELRNMVLINCC